MSTCTKLPPPLQPYLRLPPELSLTLLTGTLGCSTTWLTTRFVSSIIGAQSLSGGVPGVDGATQTEQRENAVILVSWLRDERFWRDEVRKASGLDISKLAAQGFFTFIDGLALLATSPNANVKTPTALDNAARAVETTITNLSSKDKRVTLILDAPDTLLATAPAPATTTAQTLHNTLLALRSKVHSTILTLSADLPFLSASVPSLSTEQPTPLETETAAFLVQQAHCARVVLSLRELETGAARDVSGVVRVTGGGDGEGDSPAAAGEGVDGDRDDEGREGVREMEALFLVGRDGGVRVFERGSTG